MTHSAIRIPLNPLPTPHRGRQARLGVQAEASLAAQAAISRELEEILQAKAEAESVGEARRVAIGCLEEAKRGLEMELERAREAQRRGEEERRGVEAMRAQWETRWPVHASHRHVSKKLTDTCQRRHPRVLPQPSCPNPLGASTLSVTFGPNRTTDRPSNRTRIPNRT